MDFFNNVGNAFQSAGNTVSGGIQKVGQIQNIQSSLSLPSSTIGSGFGMVFKPPLQSIQSGLKDTTHNIQSIAVTDLQNAGGVVVDTANTATNTVADGGNIAFNTIGSGTRTAIAQTNTGLMYDINQIEGGISTFTNSIEKGFMYDINFLKGIFSGKGGFKYDSKGLTTIALCVVGGGVVLYGGYKFFGKKE
jgi:hypothetical protein